MQLLLKKYYKIIIFNSPSLMLQLSLDLIYIQIEY